MEFAVLKNPASVGSFVVFLLALGIHMSAGAPLAHRKDSPIQTIIVPYQPRVISGKPYQFPKMPVSEMRQIIVPAVMDMAARFNLDRNVKASADEQGMSVNFVDGAYPVYYMPGNFEIRSGRISIEI